MTLNDARVPVVWVDGEFIASSTVSVGVSDLGFTVGLGVFDSLCGYDGVPFDFKKHYQRLCLGAKRIGLSIPSADDIRKALVGCIERNGLQIGKSRLRVTVWDSEGESKVLISAVRVKEYAVTSKCVLSEYRVNEKSPLAGVKSTSYAMNLIALREAISVGADEAIFFNSEGWLCEGATSNIFLIKDGTLITPALSSGCLPGVTRDTVLEIAVSLGFRVEERLLTREDLFAANEAFLTSSLREIQPIEMIDGIPFSVMKGQQVEKIQQVYGKRHA